MESGASVGKHALSAGGQYLGVLTLVAPVTAQVADAGHQQWIPTAAGVRVLSLVGYRIPLSGLLHRDQEPQGKIAMVADFGVIPEVKGKRL